MGHGWNKSNGGNRLAGSVRSSVVRGLDLLSSTPGITVVVGFPFIASPEPLRLRDILSLLGSEQSNLNRPLTPVAW